jgi:hypothetical protein
MKDRLSEMYWLRIRRSTIICEAKRAEEHTCIWKSMT